MKRDLIPDPRALKKDLARPPQYEALKRRCEREVVRWVWATGPLHDRTFEADIDGLSRGKALARAPKRKRDLEQYGFDSGGELMVHRSWTGPAEPLLREGFASFLSDSLELEDPALVADGGSDSSTLLFALLSEGELPVAAKAAYTPTT